MKHLSLSVIAIGAILFLSACERGVSLHSVIDVASIETIIREDNSGSNTFLLVVPNKSECKLIDLGPALGNLRNQVDTQIYFVKYNDKDYKGFQITYEFQRPEQIPEQMEQLKQVVVDAVLATFTHQSVLENLNQPIPIETQPIMPEPPTPRPVGIYYDPEQLSMSILPIKTTLIGQTWEISVNINPFLLTGFTTEDISAPVISEVCNIPRFIYKLTMPGEINTFQVSTDPYPELVKYSTITRIGANSIQWTIESKQAFDKSWVKERDIRLTELPTQLSEDEKIAKITQIIKGPAYSLTTKSTAPSPLFQVLIRVIVPLIGLIGSVLAIIISVNKIRESRTQS